MFNLRVLLLILFCVAIQSVYAQSADPTKPLGFVGSGQVVAAAEQETLQLTSILISAERKIAIINGQVLKESQVVKGFGATVKKIDANGVTLQQNGKVWRVALNSTAVRK